MSDSGVGEEKSGQVEEKLNPDEVLPHLRTEKDVRLRGLRCSKCHDFFRGQVISCPNNHATWEVFNSPVSHLNLRFSVAI